MKIKILNLDGQPDAIGDVFDPDGLEIPESVPLLFKFEQAQPLGIAKLSREGDAVYAELWLNRPMDEMGQLRMFHLVPAIGALNHAVEATAERQLIKKAAITMVGLNEGPNLDRRIKSIGEQLCHCIGPSHWDNCPFWVLPL